MTYHYESLSPDRFQQFCQALIAATFPNAQCMPVGQSDGGRDAFLTIRDKHKKSEQIIFQVKFSKDPRNKDQRDLIADTVRTEAEKINALIKMGATSYYLLTNVSGTGNSSIGSIDRINDELSARLGIDAYCWWRDDLDRRLDAHPFLKWSYTDVIHASDLLYALLHSSLGGDARRRGDAIRAYMAAQYKDDSEVKFKQVEIRNKLLDLFVDMPVQLLEEGRRGVKKWQSSDSALYWTGPHAQLFYYEEESTPGAAEFLLTADAGSRIVLEGAPGQGKSTITQFVCQAHRIRFLNKEADLSLLPDNARNAGARLPFRVDLRDYSAWLGGKNPFSADASAKLPDGSTSSLESFVAHQICHASGGYEFDVSDLSAVASASHLLIVLDGFDEVADISLRRNVVDEISRAATRLQTTCPSLQIVVTSRPAAFANSPGFSDSEWNHIALLSMSRRHIETYASKWTKARRLSPQEAKETVGVLRQKLSQPHMRDLARNPMQLAILLSLINTRGLSLPDKRTSLYDNYIELFFTREAEKSDVVREHRDLLIELHRLLGWKLHCAAETKGGTGSISTDDLRAFLASYLSKEGHDPRLVDNLFQGMVERVVALVSRVQGTWEFEVQPLREYFAARHLYETAPYSPVGSEKTGTKPERFDVIARNFYWLNVTRFYAGCYSRGELSSLAEALEELVSDAQFGGISYPPQLATMLLADWVFAQQPNTVRRVVAMLTSPWQFRSLLALRYRPRSATSLELPEKCGRRELLDFCQTAFRSAKPSDARLSVGRLIRDNSDRFERLAFWESLRPSRPDGLDAWLDEGESLDVFSILEQSGGTPPDYFVSAIDRLVSAGRFDLIECCEETFANFVERLLDVGFSHRQASHHPAVSAELCSTLSADIYHSLFVGSTGAFGGSAGTALLAMRRRGRKKLQSPRSLPVEWHSTGLVLKFLETVEQALTKPLRAWSSNRALWSSIVEAGRDLWGDRWAFYKIAAVAGGVTLPKMTSSTPPQALCDYAALARRQSGSDKWWQTALCEGLLSADEALFRLLLLFTWATPRTVGRLGADLDMVVSALSESEVERLVAGLQFTVTATDRSDSIKPYAKHLTQLPQLSPRVRAFMSMRGGSELAHVLFPDAAVILDQSRDEWVREQMLGMITQWAFEGRWGWSAALPLIEKGYSYGLEYPGEIFEFSSLPHEVAVRIRDRPSAFPLYLVQMADDVLTERVKGRVKKVGETAAREGWL